MKKVIFSLFLFLILFSALFILPDLSFSQPPPPPAKPEQNPIDGGLGLLAAAGGMYALKKIRDRKTA